MKKLAQTLLLSLFAVSLTVVPLPGMPSNQVVAAASATATNEIQVYIDGSKISFQPGPRQEKGVTLVPMRSLFQALGADITWSEQTQTIVAKKGSTVITLKIGSTSAIVSGETVKLDAPAKVVSGTTMVPLRFVSEALGAQIGWDSASRTINITSLEAQQAASQEEQYRKAEGWQIVAFNDEKVLMIETDRSQGSGVVIGPKLVLTNFHVVSSAKNATVYTSNGKKFKVEGIVAYDEEADLALIQTSTELGVDPVILGDDEMTYKGDKVYAIGSPQGVQNSVTEGLISNIYYDSENDIETFQVSTPIDHGSSGGGLFDEYGELVGLTTSKYEGTSADIGFAISVYNIYGLLDKYDNASNKTPAFLPSSLPATLSGMSNEDIAKLMAKEFGGIQAEEGTAQLTDWKVTRNSTDGLVISANIETSFYMIYAESMAKYSRIWAANAIGDLKPLLPEGEKLEIIIYYDQTFGYKPGGIDSSELTLLSDGRWQVRYPVIRAQVKDKGYIYVRT